MNCAFCGAEFTGRKRKYCTKSCCLQANGVNPNYKPEPLCLSCGKPLSVGQKKYCSGACVSRAYYKRKHPETKKAGKNRKRICQQCGKEFVMARHSLGIYCSHKCHGEARSERARKELKPKVKKIWRCKVCGKKLDDYRVYCGEECRKKKEVDRSFKYYQSKKVLKARPCKECGESFTPEYGNKRRTFCSKKCSNKYDARGNHKNRQRARRYGVDYQYINHNKVFERDGWRCQICGKATPKGRRGTCYPNAPELDHRIPISRGGGHTYDNVQCACRECNGKKSNKNEAGQLPLFTIESAA